MTKLKRNRPQSAAITWQGYYRNDAFVYCGTVKVLSASTDLRLLLPSIWNSHIKEYA